MEVCHTTRSKRTAAGLCRAASRALLACCFVQSLTGHTQGVSDPTLRGFRLGQPCAEAVQAARALADSGQGLRISTYTDNVPSCAPDPDAVDRYRGVAMQRFVDRELKDVVWVSMDKDNTVSAIKSQTYWFRPPGAPELQTPTALLEQLVAKYGEPDVRGVWTDASGNNEFGYLFGQPQLREDGRPKWVDRQGLEAAVRQSRGSYVRAEISPFKDSSGDGTRGVSQIIDLVRVPASVSRDVKL